MADQHKVQAEIMQAYRDIFLHSPQGQVILKDLMKVSGIYQTTGIRPDSELQHMEGARDMVRRIIQILSLDEEQITQIAIGDFVDVE
mgnify:CR=1 FL=1